MASIASLSSSLFAARPQQAASNLFAAARAQQAAAIPNAGSRTQQLKAAQLLEARQLAVTKGLPARRNRSSPATLRSKPAPRKW